MPLRMASAAVSLCCVGVICRRAAHVVGECHADKILAVLLWFARGGGIGVKKAGLVSSLNAAAAAAVLAAAVAPDITPADGSCFIPCQAPLRVPPSYYIAPRCRCSRGGRQPSGVTRDSLDDVALVRASGRVQSKVDQEPLQLTRFPP